MFICSGTSFWGLQTSLFQGTFCKWPTALIVIWCLSVTKFSLLQFWMSSSYALWKFNFRFCSGDSWEEGGPWCFLERQEAETILILLTAHCLFRCQLFLHLPGWSTSWSGCDESHVSFLSALWIRKRTDRGRGSTVHCAYWDGIWSCDQICTLFWINFTTALLENIA